MAEDSTTTGTSNRFSSRRCPRLACASTTITTTACATRSAGSTARVTSCCPILTAAKPLAIVDEHWSYAIRSAAAATLACKWVGPPNPKVLGLVGVGTMGTNSLRCLRDHVQVRGDPLHFAPAGNARGVCGKMVEGARHPGCTQGFDRGGRARRRHRGRRHDLGRHRDAASNGSSRAAPSSRSRGASSIRPAGQRWTRS